MTDNRATAAKQRNMQEAIASSPRQQAQQRQANKTGLPNQLKTGVESLSGHSLDDVRVHYNSARPAQLQAHAYAQGTDIHVGPGQEQHLPHEAWHVVQQKQGRVRPTMQLKGAGINDDAGLEQEADMMGAKATGLPAVLANRPTGRGRRPAAPAGARVAQLNLNTNGKKTSGTPKSIKKEVTATLGRKQLGELLDDIKKLEVSIEFRTEEQVGFADNQNSKEYKDHAGRISLETKLLGRLEAAYGVAKAAADAAGGAVAAAQAAKPKTQEEVDLEKGGFTIVKGKKDR